LLTAGIGNTLAVPLGPLGAALLLGICTARSLRVHPVIERAATGYVRA
jgi:hypothetical protein